MKFFEEPKMEVVKFAVQDVITTSDCDEDYGFFTDPCISD